MKQTFEVVFEYQADDKGYKAEELHELLQNALGNEYDITWHSVKEMKNDPSVV
jgi:hypothetical protein